MEALLTSKCRGSRIIRNRALENRGEFSAPATGQPLSLGREAAPDRGPRGRQGEENAKTTKLSAEINPQCRLLGPELGDVPSFLPGSSISNPALLSPALSQVEPKCEVSSSWRTTGVEGRASQGGLGGDASLWLLGTYR